MEAWLVNNQFKALIGSEVYGFSKITNLAAEMEYDTISEGGRNWSPLLLRKAKSKRDVMTFERGVKTKRSGADSAKIKVGTLLKGVVILIQKDQKVCRRYTFDEGIITKLLLGDLNALGNEILIEKMEVSHTGLYEIQS